MWLVLLLTLTLFILPASAQLRIFTSPDLKGLQRADLEVTDKGIEGLVGFWRYRHTHWVGAGLVALQIKDGELFKVWEDNTSLAYVEGYDVADINDDGKLDFAVAGSGYTDEMSYREFIAFYFSDGDTYRQEIVPFATSLYHLALGDVDGDGQIEVIFTQQIDSHPDSEGCSWLELEMKIGRWQNGSLQIQGTGITLGSGDHWYHITSGDVNNDGRDEVVLHQFDDTDEPGETGIGRSVLVYDLSGEPTLIESIQRPGNLDDIPKILISRTGQILEFKDGALRPDILNTGNGLFKIAPIEVPEVDLAQWKPVQIEMPTETTTLVLSQPASGKGDARQLTIYDNGE